MTVYDESFGQLYNNDPIELLKSLADGVYYIGFIVKQQGKFIEADKNYDVYGYECVIKLRVEDNL